MRLMFLVLLAVSSPSAAFDGPRAAEEYYDVREECRMGETTTGIELTEAQVEQQCARLNELGKQLTANGYCWDKSELEWVHCR